MRRGREGLGRLCGALVAVTTLALGSPTVARVPPRGSAAPPIALEGLDGQTVEMSKFEGRTVVLVFGDLLHEGAKRAAGEVLDVLADERLIGRGVVPVFVTAQQGTPETLRRQASQGRFPEIVLRDPGRAAFGDYQIVVIPSVVVVDPERTIAYAAPGFLPRSRELLTESLLVCTGQESAEEFERSLSAGVSPATDEPTRRAERLLHLAEQLAAHDLNEMAEARCREALQLAPDYLPARVMIGELKRRNGELDEAEAHFRGLLATGEDRPEVRLGLARVLIDGGGDGLEEAESLVRGVLGEDVRSARAHYALGLILERRGDCPAAAARYRRATELLLHQ